MPRQLLIDNGIRFEEGVINEDVLWTAEDLTASSSVAFLGEPLYHYIAREGSVTGTFDSRVAIVFDNCRRLKHFVLELFPELEKDCAAYCARACWSVILSASRGENKKRYPNVYARAMVELAEREKDISRFCASPKDLVLRILVRMRLYGLLRK